MESLPLLPGYSFQDPTENAFQVSHTFYFKNGYRIYRPSIGIGRKPLDVDSTRYYQETDPVRYDPSLTYGRVKEYAAPQFLPHYVIYDQKCLTFRAFFKQSVFESQTEHFRIRQVNIIYFLEDDTITIMEPPVDNSGLMQGRLVTRSKIVKDSSGRHWHWKDFNVGIDIGIYGLVYHITSCDAFTKEYLESQGVELNPDEEMPHDPYLHDRAIKTKAPVHKTKLVDDKLRRFLQYDGKILRFFAVWDDESEFGEKRLYVIYYFLADDTIQVQDVHTKNDGRDPFPLLLRKMKLPKDWKDLPVDFPTNVLEAGTEDYQTAYYSPKDLLVGSTIFILGRRLLIYDADPFTRNYFDKCLNITLADPIKVFPDKPVPPPPPLPPHQGFGSPEDSIQSCLYLRPKEPKKDVLRYLINDKKILCYAAKLDDVHPEDAIRRFIFRYSLAKSTISIYEPPIENSGFTGGLFLRDCQIQKPGSDPDYPTFYTPADFYIGAEVIVYTQRFIITGADLFVYHYMEENPEKFPPEVIESIRNYVAEQGLLKEDIKHRMCEMQKEEAIKL